MELEQIIMEIIMNAGDAKSDTMEAIQVAREKKDFKKAYELLDSAYEKILNVHKLQTELMVDECNGKQTPFSILLCHSQDHLTNALITYDLGTEFIKFMEETYK